VDERLRRLIGRLLARISVAMDALEAGELSPAEWAGRLARHIAEGHADALRAGGISPTSRAGMAYLTQSVATQLHFLRGFEAVVEGADVFQRGWNARAAMYAQSVGAPYWAARTKLLPLPALPKDGTTICRTNCGCSWEIVELAGDGNYDCFWRRAKNDSCGTCLAREAAWSPLQIRNGVVQ
jgi:hypothetical protein